MKRFYTFLLVFITLSCWQSMQANGAPGPKIKGPWVWTVASTGTIGGAAAASSGIDYLHKASGGTVTERQIATAGAIAGEAVGNRVWTSGKISPTGLNNITNMLNTIGLNGNENNQVVYGCIMLYTSRKQNTMMHVGSDDAVKVWLNGVLVHDNPIDRPAHDYQDSFPVTLNGGKNILLIAVYEYTGHWSGFFGFEKDTEYSLRTVPIVQADSSSHPPIYWTDPVIGTLHRLVDTEVKDLIQDTGNVTSLTIDAANEKLYWAEKTSDRTGKIWRANLDGTNLQLLKNLTSVPYNIAIDRASSKIYLTNSWGKIQRLNVDGSDFQPNLITGLDSPRGLAVDAARGKVYWTEMSGRIRRADLNGSNIQDVITGLQTPMDIVVFRDTIHWTEKFSENRGEIRRSDLNGNLNVAMSISFTQGIPTGIAIDALESKLYWTTSLGEIGRVNIDGNNFQPNILSGLRASGPLAIETKLPDVLPTNAVLSIFPSPVTSPTIGKQLTLNLNIADGKAVAGYQVTVQFDATALRYVKSNNGNYLPSDTFFSPRVIGPNSVELTSTTLSSVSDGDGTLATITFEVIEPKPSILTLSEALLANSQGVTFLPLVEGGEITEPPKQKGDVTADGVVNIQDLVLVASNFGITGQNPADVNNDGVVNIADLVLIAAALGTGAGAPFLHPSSLELLTTTDVREWLSQAHQLNSVTPTHQRGILVLEQLLAVLIPKETVLLPNYPNPFNPETWIPYQLAKAGDVRIIIYDAKGAMVRALVLEHQSAGYYISKSRAAYWDGRNALGERVASGIYFYQLQTDNGSPTRKMIILE